MSRRDVVSMAQLRSKGYEADFVYLDASGSNHKTSDAASDFYRGLFATFTDLDFEPTRTIAAAETVVVEWTFVGKNGGETDLFLPAGLAANVGTGRTVTVRGVSVFNVAGGAITREVVYLDFATFVAGIGVKDATAS